MKKLDLFLKNTIKNNDMISAKRYYSLMTKISKKSPQALNILKKQKKLLQKAGCGATSTPHNQPIIPLAQSPHNQPIPLAQSPHNQPIPLAHSQPIPFAHNQPIPFAHSQPIPFAHSQPIPFAHNQPISFAHNQPIPEYKQPISPNNPPTFNPQHKTSKQYTIK